MTRSRVKISITIDQELLARVRVAVEAGHGVCREARSVRTTIG